jgi:hypothetical protein
MDFGLVLTFVSVSVCQCVSVSVCQCVSVSVCQCVSVKSEGSHEQEGRQGPAIGSPAALKFPPIVFQLKEED